MQKRFGAIKLINDTYGFSNTDEVLYHLYRVLKTRDVLGVGYAQCADSEIIYQTMLDHTEDLGRYFPGDRELFYQIFQSLKDMAKDEIVMYIQEFARKKEIMVPEVLIETLQQYFDHRDIQTALITECDKYGISMLHLTKKFSAISFRMTCHSDILFRLFRYVYADQKNVTLVNADIYKYGFMHEKFDLIFSVPNFGGRDMVDKEDFICREPDLAAVQNLLYHLKPDGELVAVISAKIAFAGGDVRSLRNYIRENYKIKEIASLPPGLFLPYSAINTYLFVFSTGMTDDVILKSFEADKTVRRNAVCQHLIKKKEILLFQDEFDELDGWDIRSAGMEEDEDLLQFKMSQVKKVTLKDVAVVFRGKAVMTKEKTGNIGVINISNITDTGIAYEMLDYISEEERKIARYRLQSGDVLVTSRGTVIKTAVFKAQKFPCIPSANMNVIRPEENIRGDFIKLFLESPAGVKLLKRLQRGVNVMNINYKDLQEIEVPLLPLEDQDRLIEEYYSGLELYQQMMEAAREAWSGVQTDIRSKLY